MGDRDADRSRGRRPAWGPLVGAALLVPTVLAGLTQLWPRPHIEDQLTRAGGEALAAAGFPGAGLVLSGRDATISGVDPGESSRAVDAVEAVTGVRVATVPDAAPAPPGGAQASAPAAPGGGGEGTFGITRRRDDIVLTGVVGSEDERARLVSAASAQSGGRAVVDELTVTGGAALPAGVGPTSIGAATAALAAASADTAVSISGSDLSLTGTVADDATEATVERAVAAALPGLDLTDGLTVDSSVGAGTGGSGTGELDDAAKQQLQGAIGGLLAGAPLSFEPDSPALTGPGDATLARLLDLVRAAPGARLQIDGFVATGRGGGRLTAQQLSDQRAAAVRDALVAGGIPAEKLAARGLGEGSAPAAKAAGRRVEITVV